jgi:hypothetical protein
MLQIDAPQTQDYSLREREREREGEIESKKSIKS